MRERVGELGKVWQEGELEIWRWLGVREVEREIGFSNAKGG